VLIHLTKLGKEKRELSRDRVLKFNDVIRQHVSQEKLDNFMEVAEIINELIAEKLIFTNENNETTETTNK
jgi:hypothetical protein